MPVRGRRKGMPVLGAALLLSVLVTEALLGMQGRWAEALPLHLCGVAAIAALSVAFGADGSPLDFLWYLGMPGALLALLFPAPAVSAHQTLLNASYVTTHALILAIPLRAMRGGRRPSDGRAGRMLLFLQGLALLAYAVNCRFGTDFLFLMSPPPGPLEIPFSRGMPAYLLALEALAAGICLLMQALLRVAGPRGRAKSAD